MGIATVEGGRSSSQPRPLRRAFCALSLFFRQGLHYSWSNGARGEQEEKGNRSRNGTPLLPVYTIQRSAWLMLHQIPIEWHRGFVNLFVTPEKHIKDTEERLEACNHSQSFRLEQVSLVECQNAVARYNERKKHECGIYWEKLCLKLLQSCFLSFYNGHILKVVEGEPGSHAGGVSTNHSTYSWSNHVYSSLLDRRNRGSRSNLSASHGLLSLCELSVAWNEQKKRAGGCLKDSATITKIHILYRPSSRASHCLP